MLDVSRISMYVYRGALYQSHALWTYGQVQSYVQGLLRKIMNELTGLQEQCLLAIISHIEANESPHTRRELKQILGQKSTNGANQILDALAKKGYIKIDGSAPGQLG